MRKEYKTVSIPKPLADDIIEHIKETGYWPSLGAFVREAAIEMLHAEREKFGLYREMILILNQTGEERWSVSIGW